MTVYIVIPVFNRRDITLRCLESLSKQDYSDLKIIVCDDGSTDGTSEAINQQFPDVMLLHGDGNFWWAKSINTCIRYALDLCADGDLVLTLNDDLIVNEDYVSQLVNCFNAKPNCFIGSLVVDIHNPTQVVDAGFRWNQWTAKHYFNVRKFGTHIDQYAGIIETAMLTGRGTLIPCRAFREIGLYNEKDMPQYVADQDLSLRGAQHGYKPIICSKAIIKSETTLTGTGTKFEKPNITRFFKSFTSIRSPNYVPARYHFAKNNLPTWYFPFYLLIYYWRVTGSFFRRYLKSISPSK